MQINQNLNFLMKNNKKEKMNFSISSQNSRKLLLRAMTKESVLTFSETFESLTWLKRDQKKCQNKGSHIEYVLSMIQYFDFRH